MSIDFERSEELSREYYRSQWRTRWNVREDSRLATHFDLCVGRVVVRKWIVRVGVLIEDDTTGDAPLQSLCDTDMALRAVPSAPV
jgi:hypothetical protein